MNKIGFGTYRVQLNSQEHFDALKKALTSGVRLIDTSANYMDGQAEMVIAKVLRSLPEEISRESITIVSKGGYIQGENMQRLKEGAHVDDLVPYAEECYHSIHPDFLSDQISRSLERLETPYIDIYLLHNPEYYLQHMIKDRQTAQDSAYEEMQVRIQKAFVRLEEEVQKGRIKGYGISSNSFSKERHDIHFLDYTHLITYAEQAARATSSETHHLKALQLPVNLVELDGLACANWAHSHGLQVLVNRPLNAFAKTGMLRLAEYPANPAYTDIKQAFLTVCEQLGESTQPIRNILDELDSIIASFPWAGAIEESIYGRAVPVIQNTLGLIESKDIRHQLAIQLNAFLPEYIKQARYECSQNTRTKLTELGISLQGTLQHHALCFLLERPELSTILVGMRTPEYVDNVMKIVEQCDA